jgi:hypothetical protein
MADYTDYGYGPFMTKNSAEDQEMMISSADSRLMIGGMGAGQLTDGILGSNFILSGSITIKDGDRDMVVIDKDGMKVKDETGNYDRVTVGRIY